MDRSKLASGRTRLTDSGGEPTMSTLKAPAAFITSDDRGRAILAGTTIKVVEIALDHLANGWSPEEIYLQHGRRLSMAQIHAALSYYYEHQAEFDAEIERQVHEAEEFRSQQGESPFVRRMRRLGKLP
jgi:uncharacterized protein (DUF433 family)